MNYLMVVAHPDDELLGARANIFDTLAEDEKEALEGMGIKKVYTADFPNIKMNTTPRLELVRFTEKAIEEFGEKGECETESTNVL